MQFDDLTAIKARTSWPSAGGPTGEERAWQCLPPFWLAPMKVGEGRVEAMRLTEKGELHPLRFEWFWNGPYDHGYSFPAIVRAHPTTGDLVVGMYRSDHVVFCDPMSGAQRQVLCLEENQHSSTMIDFDQASDTMWVRGYDTLFRFSLQSLRKQRSRRLQEGGLYQNQIMTAQFIGEFVLQPERNRVCVARPFSGDVIALDWESLETVAVAMTGGQPLFLAMFDDLVVARDWKTGGVLRAVLT